MSAARINIKNIDYFKYRKLVVDGNRDDYNACSKEVKALCDNVQLLNFRDEEFDDETDRGRFAEIINLYRQILASKRIDALDMRIKSGWWGDHKNAYSAGKIKPQVLKEVLLSKAKEWGHRHNESPEHIKATAKKIDGPGLFVFKHKDHQCFQYIGRANKIFSKCGEMLKSAFEGSLAEPLAALLIISMCTDWDFYFLPVGAEDGENILRILENDLILKHDCIWPHGLNFSLHVNSLLEVSEFRKSCIRHNWPPDGDALDSLEISLDNLRIQVQDEGSLNISIKPTPEKVPKTKKKQETEDESDKPGWSQDFRIDRKASAGRGTPKERPASPANSVTSDNAEMTSSTTSSSSDTQKPQETKPNSSKKQTRATPNLKQTGKKLPASPKRTLGKAQNAKVSGSTRSVCSEKASDKEFDSATRTVTPALDNEPVMDSKKKTPVNIDDKPVIGGGLPASPAKVKSQKKQPDPLPKEATKILSDKSESSDTEEVGEGEEGKIDSSTRPVTPTLDHEDGTASESHEEALATQIVSALENIQLENNEEINNGILQDEGSPKRVAGKAGAAKAKKATK